MIAMLVLTVGLLGLLQAVNVSMEHNLKNSLRDSAVMVGEQQMNNLLQQGFAAESGATYGQFTTVKVNSRGFAKDYTVERSQMDVSSSRQFRVKVSWSVKGDTTNHEVLRVISQ